ncbi:MAG: ribonuclease HIII [Candidatus Aenigmarchaeota archaeon]|nr:ribonuclease HIII [Candidatus Aenigmarchaeota archaeon]
MGHIGVDESGKGDYFGYLVIAAVYVDDTAEEKLRAMKVRDSKQLLDSTAQKMATQIKKICKYDVVRISPEKYNLLYKRFRSLNKLLAWGHARAIENLLKKAQNVDFVLIDKFGDDKLVKEMLFENSRKVKLIQKTKAESDIAVAAASILARAEFLRTLRQLSLLIGYKLPKGSTHVEEAAKEMIKRHGPEILDKIAKVHFKITKKL